jgi:polar amino acid transport system substrate-binding protein
MSGVMKVIQFNNQDEYIRNDFMFELKLTTIVKYTYCILVIILSNNASAFAPKKCLEFHVIHTEPLGYINDKGVTTGIHWEYLEALKEHSGLCINLSLIPYARIWDSIKNGRHDGGIIFKSSSRTDIVQYVGHIQTVPTVVIPLNGVRLNNYSDLSDLIIGNMRGVHLSNKFDNDKNLNIVELNNYEQETRMINLKRLDAIAGNAFALIYQLEKYGVLDKVNLDDQLKLGEKEQWLQLSQKSQQLDIIPILRKSLTELKENGVFNDILVKYYGPLVSQEY